ncbi:MAG TPA: hypothetical protein VHL80_21570 [Polyangia bacterium]|nr:hypothetical protein [Polyangia bacterium]
MPPAAYVILATFGLVGLVPELLRLRRDRAMRRVPAKHVAQLRAQEVARVRGTVRPRSSPARSPVTGRAGVWFQFVVDQRSDFQAAPWTPAASGAHFEPFDIIEDGAAVTVEGVVSVVGEPDHRAEVASPLTGALREVLRRADVRVPADVRTHYRVSEILLGASAVVEASGRVSVEIDPRGERESLRGNPLRRFLRGTEEEPVVIRRAAPEEPAAT